MNLKNSIQNLNIKLQQKNLVIVSGNVYESLIGEKRKIVTIPEYIKDIALKTLNHSSVLYFTPSNGKVDLLDKNERNENSSIIDFLKDIKSNLDNEEPKGRTFIIDMGDVYFNTDNAAADVSNLMTEVLAALFHHGDEGINDITVNDRQTKVVIIVRESGHLQNLFFSKNIEYAEVPISLPDIKEREELFKSFSSRFGVSNNRELNTSDVVRSEAAALTDGMSLKGILQLGRIDSENLVKEELSFKELYFLATLNRKDSAWEKFNLTEIKKVNGFLASNIYGQEYAIEKTAKTLKRSFMGLAGSMQGTNSNKPKGILFYCGPTGVGKTEMAKQLTRFVFKDESRLIRFDMSEFSQEHSDQRLLGAPPGFVGFDGGGELTNAVKENPNSILLFDEIEKAHPRILDKFLQILEDGRLTSSKGELINFSETFIIFTSNIGVTQTDASDDDENTRKKFLKAVYDHFGSGIKGSSSKGLNRPEILNRIGKENIVPFNYIRDEEILKSIIKSKLGKLNKVLKTKHSVLLVWTDNDLKDLFEIIEDGYDIKDGGRGIMEVMTSKITDYLVDFLIDNNGKIKEAEKQNETLKIQLTISKEKCKFGFI